MKEIRNTSVGPLRVPLPGGKTLHLGPKKVAQIADNAAEYPGVLRLIEAGSIEILGEGERTEGDSATGTAPGSSQGHAKTPFRRGQGER